MKPRPLSIENKQGLIEWLQSVIDLVESGDITCVAAYLQKTDGGGAVSVKGELVSTDAVYGLNQIVQKIEGETARALGAKPLSSAQDDKAVQS